MQLWHRLPTPPFQPAAHLPSVCSLRYGIKPKDSGIRVIHVKCRSLQNKHRYPLFQVSQRCSIKQRKTFTIRVQRLEDARPHLCKDDTEERTTGAVLKVVLLFYYISPRHQRRTWVGWWQRLNLPTNLTAFCCCVANGCRGALTEQCLTWKCVYSQGVSLTFPHRKNGTH